MLDATNPILVVDDEAPLLVGYQIILKQHGIRNLIVCADSREALDVIRRQTLDLVITDLNMPYVGGEQLLDEVIKWQPDVPVIVVTGRQDIESAVVCTRKGAHDYLVKPVAAERIITSVRNALKVRNLQRENERLGNCYFASTVKNPAFFAEIVTRDPALNALFLYIEAIAETPYPVLLTGETGVGKDLFARAIHKASGRKGEFVAVNVAGLDDTMFSDTLFGHAKGAFSGADTVRKGMVATAKGGTLFLDEIGDVSIPCQLKLLRLMQEHTYLPLGVDEPVSTDVRIVAATNADLVKLQADGKFRSDLFYRLHGHSVRIPPLRERPSDLPVLVDHFLQCVSATLKKEKPTVPKELIPLLAEYSFPGNVRELESMITDATSRHESGIMSLKGFKEYIDSKGGRRIGAAEAAVPAAGAAPRFGNELPKYNEVRRLLAEEAMRRTSGNCSRAAEILGTTRQSLMRCLKQKSD